MPSKNADLYGKRPASHSKPKETSASGSVLFETQMAALIAAEKASTGKTTKGRARQGPKEDIFKTHNKNVKKRAAKDLEEDATQQKHRGRTAGEKAHDDANWKRTQRILEEKARKYDALKRGDIEDGDGKYAVDFDRKWLEAQEKGEQESDMESDSDKSAAEDEELVEYVDEFGRTRKGTRNEVAREERNKRLLALADESNRPKMPDNIIYGDTIQTEAFNPDENIAKQMAELAAKRDKSPSPVQDTHFDGRAEVRTRGTGFFHFSQNEEERQKQMADLMQERENTKANIAAAKAKREARKEAIEKRRQAVKGQVAKSQATRFLKSLDVGEVRTEDANPGAATEAGLEQVNEPQPPVEENAVEDATLAPETHLVPEPESAPMRNFAEGSEPTAEEAQTTKERPAKRQRMRAADLWD